MHISAQRKLQVRLSATEAAAVQAIIRKGVAKARSITRARVLLMVIKGKTDKEIIIALGIAKTTPYLVRKNYSEGGLQRALYDAPRPGQKRIFTTSDEAIITAIACSDPKEGYAGWTMDLITEEFTDRTGKHISRVTVWRVLRKNKLKPYLKKNVGNSERNATIRETNA
jgi:transposase